jgi:CHASE1-domain containing sensor protein
MTQHTREQLRATFPRLADDELEAVHERLKRYVSIAVAVANNENRTEAPLTDFGAGGSVNAGQVDPSTSKQSG